jgi:tRNA pseudouridine38-40 synthase
MKNKLNNSPVRPEVLRESGCFPIKYKLIVSYEGTHYFGWQTQPGKPTIAGTLERSFKKIFDSDISILGASRTDAGVHAQGQVAIFSTDLNLPADRMLFAWNNTLPSNIVIVSLEVCDPQFHPHYNVKQKTYRYCVYAKRPSPFIARYGWYCFKKINLERLKAALAQFLGTHDFRAFCTIENVVIENTVRTIDTISVLYDTEL